MAARLDITVFILIATFCSQAMAGGRVEYSPEAYLKNYALSTCIADAFQSGPSAEAAAAAARGYLELGSYPLEAHTEATVLGREFLKRDYQSKSGADLSLMKCIDLYHSAELDRLVEKFRSEAR